MLPSIEEMSKVLKSKGLTIEKKQMFGNDYAKTLKMWSKSFESSWDNIKKEGFNDTFRRMWRYYLGYCEGGFKSGNINVGQFLIKRTSEKNFFFKKYLLFFTSLLFCNTNFPSDDNAPAFFAEVHNFDIAIIGTYIFLAKIIDIASDPIVGWINDKKILNRKLLIILGSVLCSIGLYKLYTKTN